MQKTQAYIVEHRQRFIDELIQFYFIRTPLI